MNFGVRATENGDAEGAELHGLTGCGDVYGADIFELGCIDQIGNAGRGEHLYIWRLFYNASQLFDNEVVVVLVGDDHTIHTAALGEGCCELAGVKVEAAARLLKQDAGVLEFCDLHGGRVAAYHEIQVKPDLTCAYSHGKL